MANANTAKGLAYLSALAGMHKPVQTYVGNNPFNVSQYKPESATDIEMAKIKMKTEQIKQTNMQQSGALDVAKFDMLKSKNDFEMENLKRARQTEEDITNNMEVGMFESDTKLLEDKQEQIDVSGQEVSGTDAALIAKEYDEAAAKANPLNEEENDFLKKIKTINEDITLSENDKIQKKMELGKEFKYIKTKDDGTAEDGNVFHEAADNIYDMVVGLPASGIQTFTDLFRTKKNATENERQRDQYWDYSKEYNGTTHKDDLFQTVRDLKKRRKQNKDILSNASTASLKKVKELQKNVKRTETVTKKDILRSRADVAAETKQDVATEMQRIQKLPITIAAKNKLKSSVMGAYEKKMAKYDTKVAAATEAAKEARKSLTKMNEKRAEIREQMKKEIAVSASKEASPETKAKLRKLDLEAQKLEKEVNSSGGWFS